MEFVFLIILFLNFMGGCFYYNWIIKGVSYKKQMIVDFLCPFGSLLGRILFKFNLKTNRFAYIYGMIIQIIFIFVSVIITKF